MTSAGGAPWPGGDALALSMEEQRILDAMERKLAEDDPRLSSRLTSFGQPRLPGLVGSGRARAVLVLVGLAVAALVTLMVYGMRPLPAAPGRPSHTQQTRVVTGPRTPTQSGTPSATAVAQPSS
jgi:hypothetical protein